MASVDVSSCQISEKANKRYYWMYYILFGPIHIFNKIRQRLAGGDLDDVADCFCNCCEAAADSATGNRRYRMSRGCCPCCCNCCC